VTIPGFYDKVRELTEDERARLKELPFDEEGYRVSTGVPALAGEKGYSTLERRWARPTLDVNGLSSGFTGQGASTIIPAKASAKVSMRIVPDQNAREVADAFDKAVQSLCPPGVNLEILEHAIAPAYLCPLDSPGIAAAASAMESGFGKKPFFIREGGTLPILPLFKEVLGADSLMMGLCDPNCNAHGPNEFFSLSDLQAGARTSAHFLGILAG
jgi:succinyl-diaminopimelate desuccinylase